MRRVIFWELIIKLARQKNLWVKIGLGSAPKLSKGGILRAEAPKSLEAFFHQVATNAFQIALEQFANFNVCVLVKLSGRLRSNQQLPLSSDFVADLGQVGLHYFWALSAA